MAADNALLGAADYLPDYETTVPPAPAWGQNRLASAVGKGALQTIPANGLTPLGRMQVRDFGNVYIDADGREVAVNPQTDVLGHDGLVYGRAERPLNPEAAEHASRVGVFGKVLNALGVPDYSGGERARTSWSDALTNSLGGVSMANAIQGGVNAADRLLTEAPQGFRQGRDAPEGAAIAGSLAITSAPGAIAGVPRNTLGTFIGRVHAENLLQREGNPVPLRAIDMATALEQRGASERQIRTDVNRYIQQNDPMLGPIYRPAEAERGSHQGWMLELPNNETMALSRFPAENTTLGNVLLDPRIYRASPESERMPVLSGSAAYQAATRDGLPVMPDAAARYIPRTEGGHGRIEFGTEVHNPRKVLLEELQHHLDREAGLTAGSSPLGERAKLVSSGQWLNDPAMAELQTRLAQGDSSVRNALETRLDDAAFDQYRRNAAETRATLVRERSEMSPAALHRYLPEVNEALITPRSEQNFGGTYTTPPAGGRPVTSQEVVRFLKEAGLTDADIQVRRKGLSDTEYIRLNLPDNPLPRHAQPKIRVPTDAARHAGNSARPDELGNFFDTAPLSARSDWRISANQSGRPYAEWENLLSALKWRLSRSPDGQWLVSPDQAPRGVFRNALETAEQPRTTNALIDPGQGAFDLSEAAARARLARGLSFRELEEMSTRIRAARASGAEPEEIAAIRGQYGLADEAPARPVTISAAEQAANEWQRGQRLPVGATPVAPVPATALRSANRRSLTPEQITEIHELAQGGMTQRDIAGLIFRARRRWRIRKCSSRFCACTTKAERKRKLWKCSTMALAGSGG